MKKSLFAALVAAPIALAACTAAQLTAFDGALTKIETVINQAATDAQAACKALPAVESVVAVAANGSLPASVQNDEKTVETACADAAPVAATVLNALNALKADVNALSAAAPAAPAAK